MLEVNSHHRRLSILVDPEGRFHTPTYPEGYSYANALADVLARKRRERYAFQLLHTQERRLLRREKWVVDKKLHRFEEFPKGWKILESRCFGEMPKKITPAEAREILLKNDSDAVYTRTA